MKVCDICSNGGLASSSGRGITKSNGKSLCCLRVFSVSQWPTAHRVTVYTFFWDFHLISYITCGKSVINTCKMFRLLLKCYWTSPLTSSFLCVSHIHAISCLFFPGSAAILLPNQTILPVLLPSPLSCHMCSSNPLLLWPLPWFFTLPGMDLFCLPALHRDFKLNTLPWKKSELGMSMGRNIHHLFSEYWLPYTT